MASPAFGCALLLTAGLAAAQEHGPARERLEAFSEGLESLQADFRQAIISPEGETIERGEGAIWMQRPDLFRWQYAGEFPELIVADGARVWMYDETLEQVTVREQSGLAGDSPLMLITDPSSLDQQFVVTELGEDAGVFLLELRVRSPEAEFERVLVGLRGDMLSFMVMEDAFGMRTEIGFDNILRNPALDAGQFEFTPPPGVDIIGDPGAP